MFKFFKYLFKNPVQIFMLEKINFFLTHNPSKLWTLFSPEFSNNLLSEVCTNFSSSLLKDNMHFYIQLKNKYSNEVNKAIAYSTNNPSAIQSINNNLPFIVLKNNSQNY